MRAYHHYGAVFSRTGEFCDDIAGAVDARFAAGRGEKGAHAVRHFLLIARRGAQQHQFFQQFLKRHIKPSGKRH